jgi:uncharacterized Ntn-hydrolase superfamily protein
VFHTFSIAAMDPATGEVGAAVTTRNTCVEYGNELLDLLAQGIAPADALARAMAPDTDAARRQVGVIALDGLTVNIQVREHPDAAGELRRVYDAVSQKLGFRALGQQAGADVWGLKVIPHELGYLAGADDFTTGPDAYLYTPEAVAAVDRTSFAVMERLGVHRAASFDDAFAVYRFGPRRSKAFEVVR